LTFYFAGIEDFLIYIGGFRQDGKPDAHIQKFDRTKLKAGSRRSRAFKAEKTGFQVQRWFPYWERETSGCPRWKKWWSWD